ncbi:hypothetical protein FXO37_07758 [Capsicum annuum]|nr:hypothetical protein FXO37_07758 [Capsicum annuum]
MELEPKGFGGGTMEEDMVNGFGSDLGVYPESDVRPSVGMLNKTFLADVDEVGRDHGFNLLMINYPFTIFILKASDAVTTTSFDSGKMEEARICISLTYFYMAGSSSYKLDPGPLEPSVLTQQLTHRSRDIWDGSADMILNMRKSDGSFWKLVEKYPIHPRVLKVIKLSGLYGVYRSNRPAIDRLITLLVERWRPETYTFHFRTGEATITLKDIEVLYGLPVNGAPVLGIETTRTIGDWKNICQRLLGFVPSLRDFSSSFLKFSALKAHMLSEPQLSDMTTQEIVNQKARCYMFWMIAGTMMADISGSYLKLMYLPMLEDVNAIGSYSWGSTNLAYLYRFLCKASQSIQNQIAGFLPLLQVWAWERITVLRPQIVGKRGTGDIFPTDLHRGPHATRWFAHFSWTNTTKYVLKFYGDALDSMTEDQARHIHSMVDKAKSLGDTPSYEDLYMFRKMVLNQSSDCLRYVHEDDRIHVLSDYRRDEVQPDQLRPPIRRREKDGVAGRRERAIARNQVPVEMNEMDEATQIAQISSKDDQATTNHDFGSTSMGCTQEFTQASGMIYQHTEIVPYITPYTSQISRYPSLSSLDNIFGSYQPQHFENAPNFTSSPVPMSIDIPDATNNLENLNTEMEDNELDDANNEVNGNDSEDESKGFWFLFFGFYSLVVYAIPTTSCMFFEFKVPLIPPYVVRRINPICVVVGWVGLIIALELRGFVGLYVYCALLCGVLCIFCALMLLRPVVTDMGCALYWFVRATGRPGVLTWIALAFCILLVAVRAYLESRAVVAAEVVAAEGQELPDVARHPPEP